MEKILHGVITYRNSHRYNLLKEFQRVRDNPQPTAVFISCMDSRIFPPQFTTARVGDMFIVRNAGNLVPRTPHDTYDAISTEPGAIELGCVRNSIRDVIVCGHSDCKAMKLLYSLKEEIEEPKGTPLEMWVKKHGKQSVLKFNKYEKDKSQSIRFVSELEERTFDAYIDPEDKFEIEDKFSQINCLQQLQNISRYHFLHDKLKKSEVRLHAMWFDVYTGDVFLFSRKDQRFLLIDESTLDQLLVDSEAIILPTSPEEGGASASGDKCC